VDGEGDTHFLRKDFPHGPPHHTPHHHHHHHHHRDAALSEEGELGRERGERRWSTGDRLVPREGRRSGSPPLPFISDSHSIVGGFEDLCDGGLGYQRTLRFSNKQPLQVKLIFFKYIFSLGSCRADQRIPYFLLNDYSGGYYGRRYKTMLLLMECMWDSVFEVKEISIFFFSEILIGKLPFFTCFKENWLLCP
jgi:hypothetical protein